MKNGIIYLLIGVTLTAITIAAIIPSKKEYVNMCGQTMEEANNPINWHNGIYSPDGCVIIK